MTALTVRAIPAARRASALYCATYGRGVPVLLIHGFGACGETMQPLALQFAARYQTIVPDLRGHGQSQRLPLADSIDRLSADLHELLDLLDVGPAFVLGHAGGAAVAAQLAADYPANVRGLALISPPQLATSRRKPIASRLRHGLAALLGRNGYAGAHDEHACQRLLQHVDRQAQLRAIGAPALVVTGSDDPVSTPRNARETAQMLRCGELAVLAGGGPRLLHTHDTALADLLSSWLTRLECAA